MDRFLVIIVIISLVFVFLTYILHRTFKKKRFVKYIPPLISLILTIINIVSVRTGKGEGFKDLAAVIVAIMCFAGFISGLLAALYFDYISPKLASKK